MKRLSIMVVIIGMVSLAFGCGGGAVEPDEEGTLYITMDDFKFTPDKIDLDSGKKVRFVLDNKSKTNDHGFVVGLEVTRQGGSVNGFQSDFFEGVEVKVIGPAKLVIPGEAILTRDGEGAVEDKDGGDANGFMVLIGPSSESTVIEFIVPEKYGEWEFASFEENGTRYEDGMRGTLKVFPCQASTNSRQSRC